eukprot:220216_1
MSATNVVCANCNKSNPSKRCGGCKVTKYCSKTCQTTHWKSSHKKNCKKLKQTENKNDDENHNKLEEKQHAKHELMNVHSFKQLCLSNGLLFESKIPMKSIEIQSCKGASYTIRLQPPKNSQFFGQFEQRYKIIYDNLLYKVSNQSEIAQIKLLTTTFIMNVMEEPDKFHTDFNQMVDIQFGGANLVKQQYGNAEYGWIKNGTSIKKSFSNKFRLTAFAAFGVYKGVFVIDMLLYNKGDDFDKWIKLLETKASLKFN